jgi:hypothetical protein
LEDRELHGCWANVNLNDTASLLRDKRQKPWNADSAASPIRGLAVVARIASFSAAPFWLPGVSMGSGLAPSWKAAVFCWVFEHLLDEFLWLNICSGPLQWYDTIFKVISILLVHIAAGEWGLRLEWTTSTHHSAKPGIKGAPADSGTVLKLR